VLDLLCRRKQGGVQHWALFNFLDLLLTLLNQAFHRHAFDALEADPATLYHLVDPLDLAEGFFQMRGKRCAQIGVGRGAGKFGERPSSSVFPRCKYRKANAQKGR
jgi:hypothetical protein